MALTTGAGMSRQRGQVLAFFALALPAVLIPIVAYAVDAAAVGTRAAGLQAAAAQAAEVAAQRLDSAALRANGGLAIDPELADAAAVDVLRAEEPGAALEGIDVAGDMVTVVVSERVALPFPWFVDRATLQARATARLVAGYDSPSSRLPLPASTF